MKKGNIIILILVFVAIVLGGIVYVNRLNQQLAKVSAPNIISNIVSKSLPSSTPMPFVEMTVPYLRNRKYESKLENLHELSSNSNYTSYIASYNSDGLNINGYLTIPQGQTPEEGWPGIIFIHGYIPPQEYKTTQNYISYANYLANNKFVVYKIDLRGHDKSEGEPGGAYYSEDYIIDTLNAYSALQNSDFVNSKLIGLWGHSMAGNIVLRSIASKPDIPAGVIWAGAGYTYEDLQTFRIQDNSYKPPPTTSPRSQRRQELRNIHGDFNPESEFWRQVAPTNYLSDYKGSISLHHAVDDNVVSIEYSRNLKSILDKTTIPHELFEYSSGGHNLTGSNFNTAMDRTIAFYKKYLVK